MVRPRTVRTQPAIRRGGRASHLADQQRLANAGGGRSVLPLSREMAARPAGRHLAEAFYRFPARWLRDPLAAIVEKELRSLARTPRYRMVFLMGFSFGLMIWLPMILGNRANRNPTLSHHFLTVVCVYSLTLLGQVSFWNCFGFDRSAAAIY